MVFYLNTERVNCPRTIYLIVDAANGKSGSMIGSKVTFKI